MSNFFTTYTFAEALAMLPPGPTIDVRYETVPNSGITTYGPMPREVLIPLMAEAAAMNGLFESGPEGMKLGFAFHFEVEKFKEKTRGNLFVKTINPN